MKVVITGHMNGFGLALSNKFVQKGYTISGYDLNNDKDVIKEDTVNELITDCIDADIFVNNAHANQSLLLNQVFKLWEGKDKTVINISSAVTYLTPLNLPESLNEYISDKKNLDTTVKLLRAKRDLPHIMNIRPSWIESQLVSEFNTKKINPNDIADLIAMLYDMRYILKTSDIVLEK